MATEERTAEILQLGPEDLDIAWFDQPRLYERWARRYADAVLAQDEAQDELELASSEIASRIRENPQDYNLEKVTDAAVKELIPRQKRYRIAKKALNKAKHRVGVLNAMIWALNHRKKALEKLVDLHGQQYFSSPRTPRDPNAAEALSSSARRRARRGRIAE